MEEIITPPTVDKSSHSPSLPSPLPSFLLSLSIPTTTGGDAAAELSHKEHWTKAN